MRSSAPPTSGCRSAIPALLPQNVEILATGLEVPEDQVQLYVAVREIAHQRLFHHVPWLRSHLLGAVEEYARGITVDPEAIGRAVSSIDPTQLDPSSLDPERLSEMLGADAFTSRPVARAASRARPAGDGARARRRLGRRGDDGGRARTPPVGGRRCRKPPAGGGPAAGPAEQTFAALVGLELRPRRLRDAAALWQALREQRGIEGRDAVWAHPDLLPSSRRPRRPGGFVAAPGDSLDPLAEIAKLAGEAPEEGSAHKRVKDAQDKRADKRRPDAGNAGEDVPEQE